MRGGRHFQCIQFRSALLTDDQTQDSYVRHMEGSTMERLSTVVRRQTGGGHSRIPETDGSPISPISPIR